MKRDVETTAQACVAPARVEPARARLWMRYLDGEVDAVAAARVEEELAQDPAARVAFARLQAVWTGLDAPPPTAPPPDFAAGVVAALGRARRGEELRWSLAPAWARAVAAAALGVGLLAGLGVGRVIAPSASATTTVAEDAFGAEPLTLAEGYWLSLAGEEEAGTASTSAGEVPR